MKKFLIIFLLLLSCSGCSNIGYKLNINDDGTLSEQISVLDNPINDNQNNDPFAMDDMSAFEYFFQSLPYNSWNNNDKFYASKEFSNFNDFLEHSLLFTKFYNSNDIYFNGKRVKLNIKLESLLNVSFSNIDSLEISLYIPYYVSKNNATSVKNNTYTWKFDDLYGANIQIDFDLSKNYKYKEFLTSLCIIIVFSVIIVSIVIFLVLKHRKVNNI